MPNQLTVSEAIEATVRRELPRLRVDKVHVAEALDSDGEPIWRVTVVFTVAPTKADGPKLASLGRHIGSALEELGEYRFPITRFVSKREASQLRLAAA